MDNSSVLPSCRTLLREALCSFSHLRRTLPVSRECFWRGFPYHGRRRENFGNRFSFLRSPRVSSVLRPGLSLNSVQGAKPQPAPQEPERALGNLGSRIPAPLMLTASPIVQSLGTEIGTAQICAKPLIVPFQENGCLCARVRAADIHYPLLVLPTVNKQQHFDKVCKSIISPTGRIFSHSKCCFPSCTLQIYDFKSS